MHKQSFTRDERLSSDKIIEQLFASGNRFKVSPVSVVWLSVELKSKSPVQLLISVPKKNFKRAVDRNLLKRRIREAFRKNKQSLFDLLISLRQQCALGLIYTSVDLQNYNVIEEKIILILQRLQKEYEKTVG